jgi:tetratricopeptide (TPR) repeat protein
VTRVALALKEATLLRDQALVRPDDPARWVAALEGVKRAETALAESGDPDARQDLATLDGEVRAGAKAAERDRELLAKLVDIRSAKADDPDGSATDVAYADAFRAAGLDIDEEDAKSTAARIAARPEAVRLTFVAALDHWTKITTGPSSASARPSNSTQSPSRAHYNLGVALNANRQYDEAISSFRKAIELDPKSAVAYSNLARALHAKDQLDEAIACYEKAIALDPKDAVAHFNFGQVLEHKGLLDEAIASYKKAIEVKPSLAEAHCNLGSALKQQGRFSEALLAFKRGHELGTKQPGWPYPSAQWVREAELMTVMESKLTAFLKGEFQPKDTEERLGLIGVCQGKKLQAAAARLYTDAFAADRKLADDLRAEHLYNAACSAALAAAGQGEDAAKLNDIERSRLRKQALDWLRADFSGYTKLNDNCPPADRPYVVQQLKHWQQDTDLASIRDQAALAKLPAEERVAYQKLWVDVEALLKKAGEEMK